MLKFLFPGFTKEQSPATTNPLLVSPPTTTTISPLLVSPPTTTTISPLLVSPPTTTTISPLLVSPQHPLLVSIDGNIGSGKSTTWVMLKEAYKSRDDVHFVEEPVDSWHKIVDADGVPILTNFYKDKQAYAFRFQMMAYISRLALLRRTVREHAGRCRIIITERSVDTDRNIFAKMLYDSGDIAHDEYTIYTMWFDEFIKDLPVAGLVYIRADPETCMERITKRGREGESIPLEYIQKCHHYHEEWINGPMTPCKKLVIDANPEIVSDAVDRIATIVRFIDAL